jgi:hypothetical protein
MTGLTPEKLGWSDDRQELVEAVGNTALGIVRLAPSEEIQASLDGLGFKSRSRRQELFPMITSLGGKSLACVDVVLAIREMVDEYQDGFKGIVNGVLAERWVPSYIEIVLGDARETHLETSLSVWGRIITKKYGKVTADSHLREYENSKNGKREVAQLPRIKTQPKGTKPKNKNTKSQRKKQFDPQKSDSFKRAFNGP